MSIRSWYSTLLERIRKLNNLQTSTAFWGKLSFFIADDAIVIKYLLITPFSC